MLANDYVCDSTVLQLSISAAAYQSANVYCLPARYLMVVPKLRTRCSYVVKNNAAQRTCAAIDNRPDQQAHIT